MPSTSASCPPHEFDVRPAVAAVPAARRKVRALAHELCLSLGDSSLSTIELLTGELVANAVENTHEPCAVCVRRTCRGLRVEITDTADTKIRVQSRTPPLDAESGRGLFLVAALATAWGTDPQEHGKKIWFEIRASASPACCRR
ncbi:ATP-binding protein [Streptomyces sp. SCSIO 30461]|uniref:ATP-binding protein n=1 Tax=Streptomyces sp. SCSIO 30461 TaxID=3118085 RepID=UPI0030CF1761